MSTVLHRLPRIMMLAGSGSWYVLAKSMYFEASVYSSVSALFQLQEILNG